MLIAGGYRIGDFINFKNPRTTFLFNIGAGAGAMLLRRNWPRNHVLGSHMITDGSMSKHVIVPASGTVAVPHRRGGRRGLFYFDLVEPEAMKERLNAVSMDNWMLCVDEALRKSGHEAGRRALHPRRHRLSQHGADQALRPPRHAGAAGPDRGAERSTWATSATSASRTPCSTSCEGLRAGPLKDGDLMAIVGAGIGYVWAAAWSVGDQWMDDRQHREPVTSRFIAD